MSNPLSYDGKRVLVTGCFSGMGAATAKIVKELGAHVTGFDIKKPEVAIDEFREVDSKDDAAIRAAVDDAAAGGPIDVLFYCAGLSPVHPDFDVVLVNFLGLRETVEACVPHMARGGAIATISSAAGMGYLASMPELGEFLALGDRDEQRRAIEAKQGQPGFNAYAFSKMCTIFYTLQRGATLAPQAGVRMNCISPGPTATPMMPDFVETAGQGYMERYPRPLGADATPEQQAWILAFLGSDLASYINGENLYTDGGTSGGVMTGSIPASALMPDAPS